ncbi:MAG: YfcC family protein [Lachnospiraceae bacterium]|jgi:uncharacterized ion transporter superfamily protein YfcC|nr:YfcC family protein [Lachnospiraceae bacterium]
MAVCAAASWVLPAGEFERSVNEAGRSVVVPGTYHVIASSPVGIFDTVKAVYTGMVDAGSIVFFLFVAAGSIGLVLQTGAVNGVVSSLLGVLKGKARVLIIPVFIIVLGIGASTIGIFSEAFVFIPLFAGICIALGYDAVVGMAIIALGCGIGYSGAAMNPFTVGLAWSLADLPQFSGSGYRVICHIIMVAIASAYTIRYALKVQQNPASSVVYGDDFSKLAVSAEEIKGQKMGVRGTLILLTLAVGIGVIVYGTIRYGWSYAELSAAFLLIGLVSAGIMGWGPSTIAEKIAGNFENIAMPAMMIGIARGILIILQQGQIIDTITYALALPLTYLPSWVSAVGMLVLQTALNFLIPSGSGQAATSLPIMIPLADLLGIPRQTAVLAFQFGDGLSNILWPTAMAPIMCGMAGIKMEKWWKWLLPLCGLLFAAQAVLVVVSMWIW